MAFESKYTGKQVEELLEKISTIPTKTSQLENDSDYINSERLSCFLDNYAPKDFSNLPIDNITLYWDNGILKAKVGNEEGGEGSTDYGCLWELKQDAQGRAYIYSNLPVVTQYGITMYADVGNINLPSLYDGLPIDNSTIYWEEKLDDNGNIIKVLKAKGGIDIDGTLDDYLFDYLTDNNYAQKSDLPNMSLYVTNDTFNNTIDNLDFVDFNTYETINAIKNFKEGIEINEIGIYNIKDDIIYINGNVAIKGGLTTYADAGDIDLPSLYAGIPVDSVTIVKREEDGALMLNPNLELNGIDEEALQDYLDRYQYATKTDVDDRIDDLVNGAPQAYDTLKEIADVLQGNVNSIGDIITTLGTKADKTYVDTELAKYIPIAGDTEVTGIKDFLNGLKVGGLPISKYEGYDDVIYIDANVVLRGGLTQYAVDPVTIPSIIESLPQAGYESKGVASFSSDFFVIDANGKVSIIPDSVGLNEEELEEWLADSDYATKTYADDRYFLASNFTKVNIVAKLGISDWALAATKPSYTTKEVTEDTNLYFTNQRAIDALADTLKAYVTLKGTQTIEGEKNFTGGLKVNGSPIVYDSENGYWLLQGNLLITGGLTQYVDDGSVDLPNLYDGLPIDNQTIYWEETTNGKVLKAKVAEGGITSITSQMVIDALGFTPYDATNPNGYITSSALNGYATQTWVNQQGFLTEHQDLSGYQPKITSSAKLAASLVSGLATVATSGSYNDLSNKPTIPTSLKNPYALSWSGYSSGSYDGSAAKSITIPSNTNQLTNGAGFITSSASITGNAATASLIKPTSGTYQASTWNPLTSYTKIWGEAFINSAITSDSGDMIFYLRPSVYNSGTTELCVAIDGDFYAQTGTKKVWHEGNFTPSNYLPLSGGTLSGRLTILPPAQGYASCITYQGLDGVVWGYIGFSSKDSPVFYNSDGSTTNKIWHSGNDGSGSGLDADLLDGVHLCTTSASGVTRSWSSGSFTTANQYFGNGNVVCIDPVPADLGSSVAGAHSTILSLGDKAGRNHQLLFSMYSDYDPKYRYCKDGTWYSFRTFAFTDSNVASATKLQTARTIWGQSFDGTGNVSGILTLDNANALYFTSIGSGTYNKTVIQHNANGLLIDLARTTESATGTIIPFLIQARGGAEIFRINSSGNVGIGNPSPAYKLDIQNNTDAAYDFHIYNSSNKSSLFVGKDAFWYGSSKTNATPILNIVAGTTYNGGGGGSCLAVLGNGNVGIGTTSPAYKLDVNGDIKFLNKLVWADATNYYIGGRSNNAFDYVNWYGHYFKSAGTDRMCITREGLVGVGTTSPAYTLDVIGSSRSQYMWFLNTSLNGNAGYIGRGSATNNDIYLLSSGSLHLGTNNIDSKVFINTSGNVGIGTTSPQYKLEVNGNGRFNKYLVIGASLGQSNTARAQLDLVSPDANPCDLYLGADSTKYWSITARNNVDATFGGKGLGIWDVVNATYRMCITQSGYIGIGTMSPLSKLHVEQSDWDNGITIDRSEAGSGASIVVKTQGTTIGCFGLNGNRVFEFNVIKSGATTYTNCATLDLNGNFLAYGGITQYSDIRKKTKLQDVELTLKQVANAPLIEHYYNSDDKKTTHVGSIAQYWAEMNDWFCKLDSDGYYTMEIQNAALASAISVARELERYESKTDKKIRMLKKRINELEDEIEKLKSA